MMIVVDRFSRRVFLYEIMTHSAFEVEALEARSIDPYFESLIGKWLTFAMDGMY